MNLPISRRNLLIGIPYTWLLLFFLIPFVIVMSISLSDPVIAIPPYSPVLNTHDGLAGVWNYLTQLDFENFAIVLEDDVYLSSYLNSVQMALTTTLLCLLLGYPIAYAIASSPMHWKTRFIMAINLTFWCSFLIRIYAWIVLLGNQGVVNNILLSLGVIDSPIQMLNTDFAVYLGLVYAYLPLMIFPIYATLEKLDNSVYEASRDLGCSHMESFFRVTLPLSRPGMLAGAFLVFVPVTGEYIVPSLLGNASTPVIGRVLWNEFFSNGDWPLAASISVLLMLVLVLPIVLYQFFSNRNEEK